MGKIKQNKMKHCVKYFRGFIWCSLNWEGKATFSVKCKLSWKMLLLTLLCLPRTKQSKTPKQVNKQTNQTLKNAVVSRASSSGDFCSVWLLWSCFWGLSVLLLVQLSSAEVNHLAKSFCKAFGCFLWGPRATLSLATSFVWVNEFYLLREEASIRQNYHFVFSLVLCHHNTSPARWALLAN